MTVDRVNWPTSWRSVPLWSLFQRVKDVGHPDEEMLSVYRDYGVVPKESRFDNFNKTAENRNIYQLVDVGWLIVNRMKAWQGSLGISPGRGIVSGHYLCFRPGHNHDPRFLDYLLRSTPYIAELRLLSRGVRPNQIEIDNDLLRVLPVRLPQVGMQRAIANFLDAETARIDALITKKRRMIDLVKFRVHSERSRILWAGRPATIPLKHLTPDDRPIMYGIVLPGPDVAEGVPIVKGGDVAAALLRSLCKTTREIERRYVRSRLRSRDLVVAIRGGIGDVAMVTDAIAGANITQDVARVSPGKRVEPRWLFHALKSAEVQRQVTQRITGATIRGLNIEEIKLIRVPQLTPATQREQAAELDDLESKVMRAAMTLGKQVALLREHRQALITAAVTGDLDIPGAA